MNNIKVATRTDARFAGNCHWTGILLLLTAALLQAQAAGPPAPVFPDDTQNPKMADGAALLEAVCAGHVANGAAKGQDIGCKIACPKFTDSAGENEGWRLSRVVHGHFLGPQSDDAVLSMEGCEPHALLFGGSILLTRNAGQWKMLWYRGGLITTQCHRISLKDQRQLLVCLNEDAGMGVAVQSVSVHDLKSLSKELANDSFFRVEDTEATCGGDDAKPDPIVRKYIERVDFRSAPDGSVTGLSLKGRYGKRQLTAKEAKVCLDGEEKRQANFAPSTTPFEVIFQFDGKAFRQASSTGNLL